HQAPHSFPTRRSSDLGRPPNPSKAGQISKSQDGSEHEEKHLIPSVLETDDPDQRVRKDSVNHKCEESISAQRHNGSRHPAPDFSDRKSTRLNSSHVAI